jgi:hypothetical protein
MEDAAGNLTTIASTNFGSAVGTVTKWFHGCNNDGGSGASAGDILETLKHFNFN